jgi:hypothetical protein
MNSPESVLVWNYWEAEPACLMAKAEFIIWRDFRHPMFWAGRTRN